MRKYDMNYPQKHQFLIGISTQFFSIDDMYLFLCIRERGPSVCHVVSIRRRGAWERDPGNECFSLVERRVPSAPAWYTRVIYIFGIHKGGWKWILMFPSQALEETPFKGCFEVKKTIGYPSVEFFLQLDIFSEIIQNSPKNSHTQRC